MHTVIIGAGPSGLAAAYALTAAGVGVTVLERHSVVGGLARTVEWERHRFDIGPHRFFTKSAEVNELWREVLGAELLSVDRITRILYRNRLFDYPLTAVNTISGVGIPSAVAMLSSYFAARVDARLHPTEAENFEQWVVQHFGWRLYRAFFKTYTEKVWGIPCTTIGADWAGQRIKGLTLIEAIKSAMGSKKSSPKSLVQQFLYPREGAGMLYQRMARIVEERGGNILCNRKVTAVRHEGGKVVSVTAVGPDGRAEEFACSNCLSSAPLTELVQYMRPLPPDNLLESAGELRYRDHLSVNLIVEGNPFPDQWIYVHAREARMARVANYRNFSSAMAPTTETTPITVEYFTFPGDEIWSRSNAELLGMARSELHATKVCPRDAVLDGFVIRSHKAYPVIEVAAQKRVAELRKYLSRVGNLWQIGRSGMFKYNNQDHAIMTGLLAARAVQGEPLDPWKVNIDAEYHEQGQAAASGAAAAPGPY